MCMFSQPKMPDAPKPAPERAAMRAPDNGAVTDSVSRRLTDRARSATSTILTSGSGVTTEAPTAGKTLLGQ